MEHAIVAFDWSLQGFESNAPILVVDTKEEREENIAMKLNGYEAINYAETNGLTLNKYNDPIEDARQGLTPEEARKIANQDPSLIYITLE